jgi:hypothetical protein
MSYQDLDEKAMMLGKHDARLDALERGQQTIAADVKTILSYMERTKGSWKMLISLGAMIAGVVECIHQIVGFLHAK